MTEMLTCLILTWPIAILRLGTVTRILEEHHANLGIHPTGCGPMLGFPTPGNQQ